MEAAQSGDYATALQEWRPLAEQGGADAQTMLGGDIPNWPRRSIRLCRDGKVVRSWPSACGVSAPKNMEKQLRMASRQRRMPDNTLKLYQLGHTALMGTEMGTKHHGR
ncbi:MAG: hypothetical protein P8Q29_06920 [Tateyamaria sp.]|nr:hypothetical protein [Tateyamaria sp.]